MLRLLLGALIGGLMMGTAIAEPAVSVATSAAVTNTVPGGLLKTAKAQGNLRTFVKLIDAAGLIGKLRENGPFTIFAPTDEAFSALPPARLAELQMPANKAELEKILTYHIVPGMVTTSVMSGRQPVETLEGAEVIINATMESVHVGNAMLIKGDIFASNGVIHTIDAVLIPPAKSSYIAKKN